LCYYGHGSWRNRIREYKNAREMLELRVGLLVASMEILISGLCRGGEALMAAEVFVEFLGDGVVPERRI
jgi:pentatricopeptide repeat protein